LQEYVRESSFYRMRKSPLLEGLNDAQCEAVMHGDGPAMVVAGPGSGKTLTIIRRLLYLIYARKVPADKILVITYTKEAALSMQEKFYEQKSQFQFKQQVNQGYVSFGTFHSYFYQIIKNIKKYSEYQLITPREKFKLATLAIKDTTEEVSDFDVRRFLEQVSFYKNTGKQKDEEDIESTFQKYQDMLLRYKRMDFDDMLYLCKRELQTDINLLNRCRERYEYVLIDEYQDINPIQYELIYLLTQTKQNLFVVGDDDQSIYGFRGSDGQCFQKLLKDFNDTKTIYLNVNYRCVASIVEISQTMISNNKNRLKKKIVSGVAEEIQGQIFLQGSVNTQEMYQTVVNCFLDKQVEELNKEAVLFRTNAALQTFANKLASKHIPFIVREKINSYYEHFIGCDILDYFVAAQGCKERSLYLRLFQKLKVPIGREVLMEEQVDLEVVKRHLKKSVHDEVYIIGQIEMLERHLQRLKKMRPKLGITYILNAMNYEKYLLFKAGNHLILPDEWKEVLEWLQEDAEGYVSVNDWMQHIQISKDTMDKQVSHKTSETKGVHLMTMHSAKGLEFQKVYICNLNDGVIPKLKKGQEVTEELIEEERRLFYVAITRAKTELELHYVVGTKENPRLSSRFLEELGLN